MGIEDAAGKEELDGSLEEAGVLREERPLLGEVHLESLVDSHLRVVGFHLTEVGFPRAVERERAGQNDLGVDAAPPLLLPIESGLRGGA